MEANACIRRRLREGETVAEVFETHRFPWVTRGFFFFTILFGVFLFVIAWVAQIAWPRHDARSEVVGFFGLILLLELFEHFRYVPRGWIVVTSERVLNVYEGGVLGVEGNLIEGVRFDDASRPPMVTVLAPYVDSTGARFPSLALFPRRHAESVARAIAKRFTPGRPASSLTRQA